MNTGSIPRLSLKTRPQLLCRLALQSEAQLSVAVEIGGETRADLPSHRDWASNMTRKSQQLMGAPPGADEEQLPGLEELDEVTQEDRLADSTTAECPAMRWDAVFHPFSGLFSHRMQYDDLSRSKLTLALVSIYANLHRHVPPARRCV